MGQAYGYEGEYISVGLEYIRKAVDYSGIDICQICGKSFRNYDLSGECDSKDFSNKDLQGKCIQIINKYFNHFKWYNNVNNLLDMNLKIRHNVCDSCSNGQFKLFMNFKVVVISDNRNHYNIHRIEVYETEIIDGHILLTKIIRHGSDYGYTINHDVKWTMSKEFKIFTPDKISQCRNCGVKFLDLTFLKLYTKAENFDQIIKYLESSIQIQNNNLKFHICR